MKTTQSVITVVSSVCLTLAFFAGSCQADLVAHWTGNNNALDATGNGHDGTVNGATYGSGVLGSAFSFDGINDSVIVTANAMLEPTTISVSLWVQAIHENHLRILVDSTHGAGQSGWALQLNSSNNVSFAYGNGVSFPEVVAPVSINDGQFHHIVATLDGTTLQLFVDGTLASTLGYSGSPLASGRDIQLGNHLSLIRPLQGLLDDIRIYNHVLGTDEVSNLFNHVVPEPASAGIVGLLAMVLIARRRRYDS